MLVKDETDDLVRLFRSVQPAQFDETCIAYTGTNPRTLAILEAHDVRIFEFKWVDDWSAARNFIFEKATTDFVMWLDADDTIENASALRQVFGKAVTDRASEVQLEYKYRFDKEGNCICSFFRERIVRRDIYRWCGSVNETLDCFGERTLLVSTDVHILHHNWEIDRSRLERNLRMAQKAYNSLGRSPKEVLYFGQSLYDIGMHREAIPILEEYVALAQEDQFKVYGLFLAYHACMDAHQRDKALELCSKALAIWPDCGEIFYRQALIYFLKCDWKRTIELCEKCFDGAMPVGATVPLNPLNYTLKPAKLLAEALVADGRWHDALKVIEHTLKSFPNDTWLIMARGDLIYKYIQEEHRGRAKRDPL
jgi:tetratricopeptide (TPR) repeat protein